MTSPIVNAHHLVIAYPGTKVVSERRHAANRYKTVVELVIVVIVQIAEPRATSGLIAVLLNPGLSDIDDAKAGRRIVLRVFDEGVHAKIVNLVEIHELRRPVPFNFKGTVAGSKAVLSAEDVGDVGGERLCCPCCVCDQRLHVGVGSGQGQVG